MPYYLVRQDYWHLSDSPLPTSNNDVMQYDLRRLSGDRFIMLLRDMVKAELGLTLPPFMPWSSAGGQLSEYRGRIAWPGDTKIEPWEGKTLVNAWFLSPPNTVETFLRIIRQQFEQWQWAQDAWLEAQNKLRHAPDSKRKTLEQDMPVKPTLPDYLFFIINIDASIGSTRALRNILDSHPGLGIRDVQVWQRSKLCKILDNAQSLRTEYAGLIASDDVLKDISPYAPAAPSEFGSVITRHLAMDLIADQWVRLNEAGLSTQQKLSLSHVAIDLPLTNKRNAVDQTLEIGDQNLRPSILPKSSKPHVVLIGGPGQGKTTIGQLICQMYRQALLSQTPRIPREAVDLVAGVRETLTRIPLSIPQNRRWPIRISLTAYADAATGPRKVSLLRYIAQLVSARTTESIEPSVMRTWMRAWPWLVVLDGLDEVASQSARDTLILGISQFVTEAAQVDCDLLILATTRPQGYMGEFSATEYTHLTLSSLQPDQAAAYAKRLAEVQHDSDPDMRDKVIERMLVASKDQSTARLMRTPLQVTIMSLLLENRERAPRARYTLFDAYYHAIYAREEGKPGATGKLLEQLKNHINALHDRVGLLLQVQAEQEGEADTSVSNEELRQLAIERLEYEGYSGTQAEDLASKVIRAVTQRLVLLVPKAIESVGFEVRSIQEFLAARALVSGRDEAITRRLSVLVGSAHWRNTWLFAAGRVFDEREYYRRDLITLLEDIDNFDVVNMVVAPGADLSLDLLDDGLSTTTPALKRALARHSLTLLKCTPDEDLERRADVLYEVANSDPVVRAAADQAIDQALAGSGAQKMAAQLILENWQNRQGALGLRCRQLVGMRQVAERRLEYPDEPYRRREALPTAIEFDPLSHLAGITDELGLEVQGRTKVAALIDDAMSAKARVARGQRLDMPPGSGYSLSLADQVLTDNLMATAVGRVIIDCANDQPNLAYSLRLICRNWIKRKPVGTRVLELTPFPEQGD